MTDLEPLAPTPADDAEASAAATEVYNSVKVSLADLCAKGTAQFAHKNYEEAADLFARASELQAELNGEMSPDNAEVLFLYGRSLFKVGQSNSHVLGGGAGGEKKKTNGASKNKKVKTEDLSAKTDNDIAERSQDAIETKVDLNVKKPLFQFTGDENFEDTDDDDDDDDQDGDEGDEEEEEDDLAAAFEVLDLARILFSKKLEEPEESEGKGKAIGDSPMTKHITERLADTHDLLAEISLENERYDGAITDFKACLAYKRSLYSEESEVLAEAHFKLSLALEFGSIKQEGVVDKDMRDESIAELQAAIKSTQLKLQSKEVELASSSNPDDNDITRAQIADVKEMVSEMENRLSELQAPPVSVQALKDSIIGSAMGDGANEDPAEVKARLVEATKSANDLSGLVRRKKDKTSRTESSEQSITGENTNGKRKAEDEAEESDGAKKAKVEEAADK